MQVQVTNNSSPQLYSEVNLEDPEWSALLPENLGSFRIEESLRVCPSFPDGLFPGAVSVSDTKPKQITRVKRFPNYIEFSKIVSDEVVPLSGQLYLTTKFYQRRYQGWSSDSIKKKEGEVLGYCIDGDIYSPEDLSSTEDVFYGTVYRSIICNNPIYLRLVQQIKDGICINLKGTDKDFLEHLSKLLRK